MYGLNKGSNDKSVQQVNLDVLLIEHDDMLADMFNEELKQFGADLHRAEEIEEAFVAIEGKKLDAVFVDLNHPTLDPFHIIAAVRRSSSNKTVPIVALVSHDDLSLLERASRTGATHFLPKPIVWDQMHQLMKSIHWKIADERRYYRRAKAAIPVLCTFQGSHVIGRSANISSSGMLLQVDEELPAGTEVVVAFPHSEQSAASFLLTAKVVRCSNSGDKVAAAMEFVDIPEERVEKLLMWVDLFHYIEEGVVGS